MQNSPSEQDLAPFTLTRAVEDIRIGILTIREKMAYDPVHANQILQELIHPWQIFQLSAREIAWDFAKITANRKSAEQGESNRYLNRDDIFIEPGAVVRFATLNAEEGPIYIGRGVQIMEGAHIRGPVALGEGSVVKMGACLYPGTSIGPYCTVGGEIKNVVMLGFSNKAHEGYLGDAVIGEWCNLGAGTSSSNLKNNASMIRVWSMKENRFVEASQKCGLMMGDYTRCAINTSFNSGTLTGVCCNIFGTGPAPKFIPNFNWGLEPGNRYRFEKALDDISNWKKLKNRSLSAQEIQTLKLIFEQQ